VLFDRNVESSGATELLLHLLDGGSSLFESLQDSLRHECISCNIVSLLGSSNVKSVKDSLGLLGILCFLGQSMVKKNIASFDFDVFNSILGDVRHLDQVRVRRFRQLFDFGFAFGFELAEFLEINFGEDNDERFSLEERLDRLEQRDLLVDSVATGFGDVEQEQDCGVEMGKCGHSLHFDRVSLVERVIQNSGRVNNLPLGVLVLAVTDEQVLGGESVGLHINVSIGNIIDEG